MPAIFISYRDSDTQGWAIALRDELAAAFGADAVFLDKDQLGAGTWSLQIEAALRGAALVIVIIGPKWLDVRGPDGRRRLEDPDDVHRREIAQALAQPQTTVLPLLVQETAMPLENTLPKAIAALSSQQALSWSVRVEHRRADRVRLLDEVRRHTGLEPSRPAAIHAEARSRAALPPVAALLMTIGLATWFAAIGAPLSNVEWLLLLAVLVALAYGARAIWRSRASRRQRV